MKITSTTLAWVCVALLVLYPVSAVLVQAFVATYDYDGILAALFAANAGTALIVRLAFGLPHNHHISRALSFIVSFIGIVCVLMSALYWLSDEVDNAWLRAGIISPVLVTLLVLMWFIDLVKKEGPQDKGE